MGKVHLGLLNTKKPLRKIRITHQVFLGLPCPFIQTKGVSLKVVWSDFIRLFKPAFLLIISVPLELVSNRSISVKIFMTCKMLKIARQIFITEWKELEFVCGVVSKISTSICTPKCSFEGGGFDQCHTFMIVQRLMKTGFKMHWNGFQSKLCTWSNSLSFELNQMHSQSKSNFSFRMGREENIPMQVLTS